MSRETNANKLLEWTERLKRFEKSNQTVTDFCSAETVSPPSFYYWRHKLGDAVLTKVPVRRRRTAKSVNSTPGFQSVFVTPSRDSATVRIRLPGGVVIELGDDELVMERVIRQLLHHEANPEADACCS